MHTNVYEKCTPRAMSPLYSLTVRQSFPVRRTCYHSLLLCFALQIADLSMTRKNGQSFQLNVYLVSMCSRNTKHLSRHPVPVACPVHHW